MLHHWRIFNAYALGTILLAPLCASQPSVRIVDAVPFTGTALIPADADIRSIHFEGLKSVRVPSRIRYTIDPAYCRDLHTPGASQFCPSIQMESPVAAIEVTYTYSGPSMASADHGGRQFTFDVYFQPSDLPAALREALSGGKTPSSSQLSRYFAVETHREPAPRYILDERRSVLCEGSYVDGSWQPDDPDCDYTIRTNTVPGLSDFITVTVTVAPPGAIPDASSRVAAH
jgi:hypothetical protein